MPTQPSKPAAALASRLIAEGFEDVSPVLVQRWRERGLLGRWERTHRGGPGSNTLAAVGAYDRARLLARLHETDRNDVTVSLLAYLTGVHVDAAEIRHAINEMLATVLVNLAWSPDSEPIDRAEDIVRDLVARRRGRDRLRALSAKLDGVRDPQWQPDVAPRSVEQRTKDVLTALLTAVGGDPSWVAVVLPDALRLQDMDEVVVAAELDDPMVAAETEQAFEATLTTLLDALGRLDDLTDDDVRLARETSVAWVGEPAIAELAESGEPIVQPAALTPLILGPLLSQLAMPGQLHAQIMQHRASAASIHAQSEGCSTTAHTAADCNVVPLAQD